MQSDPRYPIGRFDRSINVTEEMRSDFIQTIETLPAQLRKEVEYLKSISCAICLAQQTSYCPHYRIKKENGLVSK